MKPILRVFRRVFRIAAVLLLLAPVSVGVAGGAGRNDPEPCRFDVQRFCHGVVRGQGRLMNCLLRHWDDLTPACKKDVDYRRQKR